MWLALNPCDALAQLRLPGGGPLGSIGPGGGIGPGLPGSQLGTGAVDNPVNDRLPALSVPLRPAAAGTLINTLNGGVTGTISSATRDRHRCGRPAAESGEPRTPHRARGARRRYRVAGDRRRIPGLVGDFGRGGHVSGIAALLLELKPGLAPDAARKILQSTARDLGPKGRDDQFGAGVANAYRAVRSLRPDVTPVAASTAQ